MGLLAVVVFSLNGRLAVVVLLSGSVSCGCFFMWVGQLWLFFKWVVIFKWVGQLWLFF